uniref:Nucleocapsid n=1 Tax=Bat paramyxovirus TaxID=1300978 RepID=A0A0D3MCB8_9MONO|nr:nucleocapsid protein [Bat paramyxovirus]
MASVFKTFEQFTLDQEQHDRGNEFETPPETLQSQIRVFILNTTDPQIRYELMNFCLRLVVSQSAKTSTKHGAILTMLSLPTAMMKNHIKIADRSPDAHIERIEVDGFEQGTYRLIPNPRTPLAAGEITAYAIMAEDLPDSINGDTVFINAAVEHAPCDEMEQFLEAIYSVLLQLWVMVCKCMTAYDQPTGSDERRLAKYQQQGRLHPKYMLQDEVRRILQKCIRDSLVVRQFLTSELQTARRQGSITSKYYAMVGDIGKYIENAGMSAFFMTARHALGTKWPPLALACFSGELVKFRSLMLLYKKLGEKARFMALLEMPEMMEFAPANYPLLFSYAMGVGSVLDPQLRNYNFGRSFFSAAYFQLGVETANRQQGAVDKHMAEELGLTAEEKRDMAESLAKLAIGKGRPEAAPQITPFQPRSMPTQKTNYQAQAPITADGGRTVIDNEGYSHIANQELSPWQKEVLASINNKSNSTQPTKAQEITMTEIIAYGLPEKPHQMDENDYEEMVAVYCSEVKSGIRTLGDYTGLSTESQVNPPADLMGDLDV